MVGGCGCRGQHIWSTSIAHYQSKMGNERFLTSVLVIDDNLEILQLLARCLDRANCHPTCAASALEGIQIAKKVKSFDLYLVDLDLPDVSGLHVGLSLRHLMKHEKVLTSPIIAVTAQSDDVTRKCVIRYGFSAFLGKPFTERQISNLVQHYREGQRQ